FGLDIQVTPGCIRKRLEEMEEHFCGHFANLFAREGRVPYQPGSPAKIDSDLGEAVVHRQAEAIAFDSSFVTQRLRKGFTQRERSVFNGMVFIDMEVSFYFDFKVKTSMPRKLVKHVVEEPQAC